MTFDKDVFISYAHRDNQPPMENTRGWVSAFYEALRTKLEERIGKEVSLWGDKLLTGNSRFHEEIEKQLNDLKALVSIISPSYLNSNYCKKELGLFFETAEKTGGLSVERKSRIFKILKTPVDREAIDELTGRLHELFADELDYKFFRKEPETGRTRELLPYSWVDGETRLEYLQRVSDVAEDLAKLIKALKSSDKEEKPGQKIFLAETSYDLEGDRDNLLRELKERGFDVLPSKKLPYVADRFIEEVESCLGESILSVHLVSRTNYAVQPEGSDRSVVILQNELAGRRSASDGFPRLVWIPRAAPNANEKMAGKQQEFVSQLKGDASLQQGADILEGSLEEFKMAIFDTVKKLDDETRAKREAEERAKKAAVDADAAAVAGPSPKLIYLVYDQRDAEATRPLEDLICDSGHVIQFPVFEGEQAHLQKAHEENVTLADAVIVFYGAGNRRWAQSITSDLRRLLARGRDKPLLQKAIYLSGPADAEKTGFRSNDFPIINGLSGFDPQLFNGFFQTLR